MKANIDNPPMPKTLYHGTGWRIIQQIDDTITLNLTAPVDISVTNKTMVITLPADFLLRTEKYRE